MVRVLQTDLDFSGAVPDPEPAASPDDVDRMMAVLKRCTDWVTAAALAKLLGEGWSDRKVRRVASAAAPNVVSFPGAKGYKLWGACSIEEIQHAIAAFERQSKEMAVRAALYQDAYHRRFRG